MAIADKDFRQTLKVIGANPFSGQLSEMKQVKDTVPWILRPFFEINKLGYALDEIILFQQARQTRGEPGFSTSQILKGAWDLARRTTSVS